MDSGELKGLTQEPGRGWWSGRRLRAQLDRHQPNEWLVLSVTALLVGLGTGLGAAGFIGLIGRFRILFFDVLGSRLLGWAGPWSVVLLPALGGG